VVVGGFFAVVVITCLLGLQSRLELPQNFSGAPIFTFPAIVGAQAWKCFFKHLMLFVERRRDRESRLHAI
jgi:hypothetical protein